MGINIESTDDQYLIQIDKNLIDKEYMLEMLSILRVEELAQRVNIDESIIDLGKQIKASWWKENKDRLLKGT